MDAALHYAKTLEAFSKNGTYMEACVNWIKENIPGIINNIIEVGAVKDDEKLRIISIGPGEGEPDAAILDEVTKFKLPVHYTAVDPNMEHMNQFEVKVARNSKYANVDFDLKKMTDEEYLAGEGPCAGFHLVVFIHSLYYFSGRVGDVLETFYHLTEEDGYVVAITSEKDWFLKKYEEKLPIADNAYSQDIDIALENGNLYFERKIFQYQVDIGSIFDGSSEGDILLDFLTHIPHFRETFDRRFVEEVLEDLKKLADEKLFLQYPTIVHMIHKKMSDQ